MFFQNDELTLDDDKKGDQKIDPKGNLLGGKQLDAEPLKLVVIINIQAERSGRQRLRAHGETTQNDSTCFLLMLREPRGSATRCITSGKASRAVLTYAYNPPVVILNLSSFP